MAASTDLLLLEDAKGQRTYNVTFFNDVIIATVTHINSVVDNWIEKVQEFHRESLEALIVGLDVEWPPNNPLAILKLCVGRHCLIYQLLYAEATFPESLIRFLDSRNFKFFGVGIRNNVFLLNKDHGLNVRFDNMIDLQELALEKRGGDPSFANLELNDLALRFLNGKVIEKPQDVIMSNWYAEDLVEPQVQYACIDAFLCFEIATVLMSGRLVDGQWVSL